MAALLLLLLLAVLHVTLAVDLPYPRSAVPTGRSGEPVYVVSEAALPARADQVTLQTMAGVLARHSPRVYTIKSQSPELTPRSVDDDTTVFWLHDLATHHGVSFNYSFLANPRGLIALFIRRTHPEIMGFVAYNPAETGSVNAALTRCAALEGVIAAGTQQMVAFLAGELRLPMVANLSRSTPLEEFRRFRPALSNRAVVAQPDDGGKSQCLSEYAVFARIPTLEHGDSPAKRAAFQAVLDNFAPDKLNAAFGWTSYDEHELVAAVTLAGGMVHASDFVYNLAVLSQLPPHVVPRPAVALDSARGAAGTTAPRAVHTVAFVHSDGDNLQILQNDWLSKQHWNHPLRGHQPAGWSYSPAMAALMPSLLAYAARTASANDSLSAGPSGAGYVYPGLFSAGHRRLFALATGSLMNRSGMTLVNVIGVTPSEESVADLAEQPEVQAIVYFTFGVADQGYAGLHGNVAYVGGKPVVGLRSCLWDNGTAGDKVGVPGLVRELKRLPKDTSDPRSYSIIDSQIGNSLSEVAEAARQLALDGGFDVVLPEELVRRLVRNTGHKQLCPMPTGRWADQAGLLPKCWLPRDGKSCVLECDGPDEDAPVRCDLSVCSNLTFAPGKRRFLCAETGEVCPGQSAGRAADLTFV